jgi:hypothetical protein
MEFIHKEKLKMKNNYLRVLLGLLLIAIGVILALYVGGWLLFIKPILAACAAYDTGTLTGVIVGKTVLKCIFASEIGGFIAWIFAVIGVAIMK